MPTPNMIWNTKYVCTSGTALSLTASESHYHFEEPYRYVTELTHQNRYSMQANSTPTISHLGVKLSKAQYILENHSSVRPYPGFCRTVRCRTVRHFFWPYAVPFLSYPFSLRFQTFHCLRKFGPARQYFVIGKMACKTRFLS